LHEIYLQAFLCLVKDWLHHFQLGLYLPSSFLADLVGALIE